MFATPEWAAVCSNPEVDNVGVVITQDTPSTTEAPTKAPSAATTASPSSAPSAAPSAGTSGPVPGTEVVPQSTLDGDVVKGPDGQTIGTLQPDGKTVVDSEGNVVGVRSADGAVVAMTSTKIDGASLSPALPRPAPSTRDQARPRLTSFATRLYPPP